MSAICFLLNLPLNPNPVSPLWVKSSVEKNMTDDTFKIPSKASVRKAGLDLTRGVTGKSYEEAVLVLSLWRGIHAHPSESLKTFLARKVKTLKFPSPIVAQRLKRTPSIIGKLKRFPDMGLDRMQDIGGLRVVLNKIEDVYALHESLINTKAFRHQLDLPPRDYIKDPKTDGYRSLHQIVRYRNAKHPELNGLRLEIQIRTKLQHSWATAVETLGIIQNASFKTGEGEEDYRRFFRLASALFSIYEKQPVVAEYRGVSCRALVKQLDELDKKHSITKTLSSLVLGEKQINSAIKNNKSDYQVLELNSTERKLYLTAFTKEQLDQAESYYRAREMATRNDPSSDVVLISVGALREVKRAYPNYFLNTSEFTKYLLKAKTSVGC